MKSNTVHQKLPVAIPAFKRPDLLLDLLNRLPNDRVSRVYISIDGPNRECQVAVNDTLEVAQNFAKDSTFPVYIHALSANVGAALNVLGTVNWMFCHEELGVVLEDDCQPIPEFFDFVTAAVNQYAGDPRVWLVCGTQFAPPTLMHGNHVLSRYPLIWGWGTSRTKWSTILYELKRSLEGKHNSWTFDSHFKGTAEKYFHSGHRRSSLGFVDAWDLPLVYAMRQCEALAVLPIYPLISNVGDDPRATHTVHEMNLTRLKPQAVNLPLIQSESTDGQLVDAWLEAHLFKIRLRHLLSTSARWFSDAILGGAIRQPLAHRLRNLEPGWSEAPGPTIE